MCDRITTLETPSQDSEGTAPLCGYKFSSEKVWDMKNTCMNMHVIVNKIQRNLSEILDRLLENAQKGINVWKNGRLT